MAKAKQEEAIEKQLWKAADNEFDFKERFATLQTELVLNQRINDNLAKVANSGCEANFPRKVVIDE